MPCSGLKCRAKKATAKVVEHPDRLTSNQKVTLTMATKNSTPETNTTERGLHRVNRGVSLIGYVESPSPPEHFVIALKDDDGRLIFGSEFVDPFGRIGDAFDALPLYRSLNANAAVFCRPIEEPLGAATTATA